MNSARIRVVIVDDEPIARRGIRHLLAAHDDFEISGEARNGKEAVRLIGLLSPDLVFLDVQMPEIDGFAVLRRVPPERLPAVIFVTAYDTFAVRAFEAHALDYLVKPINEARFRDALTRARDRLRSNEALQLSRRLSVLLSNGNDLGPVQQPRVDPPRRLVIGAMGSDLIVDVAQISWIEADDYYAAVHAAGRRHLVRESLASLETRLDPFQFVRTHRAAIVNLSHVREIKSDASGESSLVLSDGTLLPLSRRRRRKVEAAMRRFAG
jgi:two-component system LytT family response regulator